MTDPLCAVPRQTNSQVHDRLRLAALILGGLLIVSLFTACASPPAGGDSDFGGESALAAASVDQVQDPTPLPQPPVTEATPEESALPLGTGTASAPLAQEALRFVFPAQKSLSVSAWRPPLYEVPWALTPNDHFYFTRPIAADEVNWPLADYRYGGKFFANTVHTGIDIPAPYGTPVLATGAGKVIQAGYGVYSGGDDPEDPYGLAVVIRHDFGYQGQPLYTVYGHLSQIEVVRGQLLEGGDRIGAVGDTGFTTGPHLHFEVRIGDNRFFSTRNPELWLAPPLGWGVLAGRVMDSNKRLVSGQIVYLRNLETRQLWTVYSYGSEAVNSDPYYQENLVIGDLPAGPYRLSIPFYGVLFEQEMTLKPGLVNYFSFEGYLGFADLSPPTPGLEFDPHENDSLEAN